MATVPHLQPGDLFAGDYRIQSKLDEGGMGRLYVAEQMSTGKRRALKLMLPELVQDTRLRDRFVQEARVGAKIASEHVVEVVGAGVDPSTGTPWIAMELLEGSNLEQWRARNALPSAADIRLIAAELFHAMSAAHDAGIVHRDLKPQNVFLAKSQRAGAAHTVKVLDFGIAKLVSDVAGTRTAAMGTPLWMAPEQTEASSSIAPSTDVWALGLIVFWLLTGKHYWKGANVETPSVSVLMREVVIDPLVPASARAGELGCAHMLPRGFDGWFSRCVSRQSYSRFRNAREAFAALDPLLAALPPGPTVPGAFGAPGYPGTVPFGVQVPFGAQPGTGPFGPVPAYAPPPSKSSGGLIAVILLVLAIPVVLGVLAGVGAVAYVTMRRPPPVPVAVAPVMLPSETAPIPVTSTDAVWGNPAAPVTIVVFGEYECPYCGRLDKTIDDVADKYGSNDVRVVWKHFPLDFHKSARPAAIASETVRSLGGNGAFWTFHDLAFKNQRDLTEDNFERWAVAAGVDAASFRSAMATKSAERVVDDHIALGKSIGVRGTPSTYVNGIYVSGAQPLSKFVEVVDAERDAARALAASGTPVDDVYAIRCKKNRDNAPPSEDKGGEKKADDNRVYRVPVGDSPVRGANDALVTVVLFSDYQCPFCKRVEPTLDRVREEYGDDVRVVWKDRPLAFHARALAAAQFAREVRMRKGDEAYWRAHDLLFANNTKLEDEDLRAYASKLGLDPSTTMAAVQSSAHQRLIDEDTKLADTVGAKGTPTMFINGRQLVGAQPFEKFKALIDEERAKARSMVAAGTPRAGVYEAITAKAKANDDPPYKEPDRIDLPPPDRRAPWKGAADAPIVIQVFSEFQCAYCGRLAPTLEQVLESYPGKVKLVWRHMPLPMHADAKLAAEASVEVHRQLGNDGFWKYHDLLFQHHEDADGLKRAALERYAEQLGVNMAEFRAALDDHRNLSVVDADIALAGENGIRATPIAVVNGQVVRGAVGFDRYRQVIDQLLER